MNFDLINQLSFSATGTSELVASEISQAFSGNINKVNLLRQPVQTELAMSRQNLTIVALPVYSGRVPALCLSSLNKLKGNGSPAIAAVVFGNRAYDDALLELVTTLSEQGFLVIAAGAFVAQHSIFPEVGAGRPDKADHDAMAAFSRACKQKLEKIANGAVLPKISVKGNFPYRSYSTPSLKPTADDSCTACGLCAEICPVKAISAENPKEKKLELCIACTACIAVCPTQSQAFRGLEYDISKEKFCQMFSARQDAETFL